MIFAGPFTVWHRRVHKVFEVPGSSVAISPETLTFHSNPTHISLQRYRSGSTTFKDVVVTTSLHWGDWYHRSPVQSISTLFSSWTNPDNVTNVIHDDFDLGESPDTWTLAQVKQEFSRPTTDRLVLDVDATPNTPIMCPRISFSDVPCQISDATENLLQGQSSRPYLAKRWDPVDRRFQWNWEHFRDPCLILAQTGFVEKRRDSGELRAWLLVKEGCLKIYWATDQTLEKGERENFSEHGSLADCERWISEVLKPGQLIVLEPHSAFAVSFLEDTLASAGNVILRQALKQPVGEQQPTEPALCPAGSLETDIEADSSKEE